jgi:pyrroloquinoline quinone biosynthesis protein B
MRLRGSSLVFFDGTLFSDDELIEQGLTAKTGRRMGHIAMAGAQGSLAAFEALNVARRVFVHINNSNPALREDSAERAAVAGAGWEIAWDGMEIEL